MDLFSQLQPLLYFLFLLVPLFLLFLHGHHQHKKPTTSPGLKYYPVLGHLPHFVKNSHRFVDWSTELLLQSPTQTFSFRSPISDNAVVTANPINVEHMLKANFGNFPKGDLFSTVVADFLGSGIFNADGEEWRRQRKTASFEFNMRTLRSFAVRTVHHEIVGRLLPLLRKAGEERVVLDLQDVLQRFAFDNICRVTFGVDPACLTEENSPSEFMRAFDEAAFLSTERFMYPLPHLWQFKRLLGVGSERKLRQNIAVVKDYTMEIIRSRKRSQDTSSQNDDLLSRFSVHGDMSDELLRDIAISFILAGRETTSSALTWFFWLLSSRPDVEEKILEEIKSTRLWHGNSGETFAFEELREMHYLHAAITESLRLYPPVAIDTFSCKEDDVFPDGTFIGKGWFATYNAYAMGRAQALWGEDCLEYRPERWLVDGAFRPESPFKFLAFHAGPRACLGKEMAYIQMKSIAACVLERFAVEVVGKGKHREHVFSLTLRMKGGLPVYVRKRDLQMAYIPLCEGEKNV